ncbi:NADH-quinone oxidoreductase subunit L [Actinomadura craniellae]|uniref:NADH-quinone oxidoreductase subunit L n=2 Tax=Actinomadura craniellae TaxID=2231787 RepID=A0A365H8X6_9ACTN|nr:NADH-quinone oxidoreductase subunit L [Actinomadura craniellae]
MILLPFLAAFAGFLAGPRLTRALGGPGPAPGGVWVPGGGPRASARSWAVAAGTAARVPLRNGPALLACVPTGLAALLSLVTLIVHWADPGVRSGVLTRVPTGGVDIVIGVQTTGPAVAVGLMVCCVALAVQVYSIAYMAEDPRYSSYAAFVSLFTAAMLLVVFAGDLLLLYVGWEVMGVCSYFLIGHHWEERANSRAAVKAFLVTRLGDVGFLLGILVLGAGAGTFWIDDVLARVPQLPDGTVLAAALLLLAGVAGKSAQFPLHTWLPDAMAGPTPISALIHAATMVAAGIYVVVRLYPVFSAAPAALAVLGVLAAISMLGAALAALAQDDLKRVLAYSTISQLAYMAAGLAVGAREAATFHLLTHGAFKALLFLAAGCVILVTGSNLLRDHGGLRRAMPITFWSMTVGFAALAGLPPASGFFSKDAIIEAAQHAALHPADASPGAGVVLSEPYPAVAVAQHSVDVPGWVAWVVYLSLLATVAVTAAYATRAWLMTFFGEPRSDFRPREAPVLMSWPVAACAVPAALLGLLGLGDAALRPHLGSALLSLLLVAAGAGAVYLLWNRDPALDPARALGPLRAPFARAFYLDELYALVIVRPVRALAGLVVETDDRVIDSAVRGAAPASRGLGGLLRRPQDGNPQTYLTGLLAGVVVIAVTVAVLQ